MSIDKKIKINAYSQDDLKILSFLCQDAICSNEEFFFDKENKLFVATLSRYCWEKENVVKSKNNTTNYRVVSGLQIKNVEKITYKKFKSNIPFLNLLAILYKEGNIILNFSMSNQIVLYCQKIDIILEDIDIPWPTKLKPEHE